MSLSAECRGARTHPDIAPCFPNGSDRPNVCFWHLTDMRSHFSNVCFGSQGGHHAATRKGLSPDVAFKQAEDVAPLMFAARYPLLRRPQPRRRNPFADLRGHLAGARLAQQHLALLAGRDLPRGLARLLRVLAI